MPRAIAAIVCLFLIAGCAAAQPQPAEIQEEAYGRKIRDWQERIRQGGWSDHAVRSLLAECRGMVRYEVELEDHWSIPREFIANGLKGDCEDIAAFLMGTLKRLDYPNRVRILIVKGLFNLHALLKVELPSGRWAFFETMPGGRLETLPPARKALVEFDDTVVIHRGSNLEL